MRRMLSGGWWLVLLAMLAAVAPMRAADEAPAEEENPYLAAEGLSPAELAKFLTKMATKPEPIQKRTTFQQALADAAERILNAEGAAEADRKIGAQAALDALHTLGEAGDAKSDEKLFAWSEKLKEFPDDAIKNRARLHLLEQKTLSNDVALEDVPKLLEEIKVFFSEAKPKERELRLASAAIGQVNRLDDKLLANFWFDELGGVYAKSEDKALAKYGKQILKKPGEKPKEVLENAKPIKLTGKTLKDEEFDIGAWQGKVVLIDFWATWCGPCRELLPALQELYGKQHDKGLEIVGVSVDEDREALDKYITERLIVWPTLFVGDAQATAKKFGLQSIPRLVLVGKDGNIVNNNVAADKVAEEVAKLLEAK